MAVEQYSNLASTTLGANYTAGSGVLQVLATGGNFPTAPQFHVTILDASTGVPKVILKVTVITDSTHFAVTAEGADANATTGDVVKLSLTKASMDQIKRDTVGRPFPFDFVQEGFAYTTANVTNFTVTFGHTTAASGNTIFMIVAADGSQTITLPSGWTADINQLQLSYSRLIVLHKTTASDTSATFSFSGSTISVYYFEITGARALDQSSTSGAAIAATLTLPSITPSAGAIVFAVAALTGSGSPPGTASANPFWTTIVSGAGAAGNSARFFYGVVSRTGADGTAVQPPMLGLPALFGSSGMAYSTFSII